VPKSYAKLHPSHDDTAYADPRYLEAEQFYIDQLRDLGIRIKIGTDMSEYRQIVHDHDPDRPTTLPFRADSIFANQPAIWIAGFDDDNALVHTQATRSICPASISFANYFKRNFHNFPPPALPIDFENSELVLNPNLVSLSGTICYHGEVWLQNNPQYRGGRAIGLTGALNFVAGVRRLKADAFVGIMTKALGDKGLPSRQGYFHASPDCLTWQRLDSDLPIRTYIVHQTKSDIDFLISRNLKVA